MEKARLTWNLADYEAKNHTLTSIRRDLVQKRKWGRMVRGCFLFLFLSVHACMPAGVRLRSGHPAFGREPFYLGREPSLIILGALLCRQRAPRSAKDQPPQMERAVLPTCSSAAAALVCCCCVCIYQEKQLAALKFQFEICSMQVQVHLFQVEPYTACVVPCVLPSPHTTCARRSRCICCKTNHALLA